MTQKFDTIIYHYPCSDGITGAWAIWKHNKTAKLVPATYGMVLNPEDYVNKTVAIVDFSFSKEYILSIAKQSTHTVLLDHHKSSQKELEKYFAS
jgi:hypothetical protein